MKEDFIGVFDSGIGGLTVLDKLVKMLPNENFVYVADQGYCPYGPRTSEYVGDRVEKISKFLENKGAKAIVIACNTASLQIERGRKVCDIPIISVIYPTAKKAISLTKNKKVCVLATEATIKSGTYQKLLEEKGITAIGQACGSFVTFVESGNTNQDDAYAVVKERLDLIKDKSFDTLIHGCTHFSLLEKQMREILGEKNYVACGEPTGEELVNILKEKDLLNKENKNRFVHLFTTGELESAIKSIAIFHNPHDQIQKVEIK